METNFWWIGMAETPIQTAFELDMEEESSDLGLSKLPRLDLKANPTQPTLEVEEEVEDHHETTMVTQALETPRYCLVAFTGTTLASASNGDGSPGESILEALNKSGDSEDCDGKGYNSDKYDAAMKIYEAEIAQEELEEKQAATRQVFVTNKGDDARQGVVDPPSQAAQDIEAAREQGNPPPAAHISNEGLPKIQGGPRQLKPAIPMEHRLEDFVTPVDKIVYRTLGDPITPEYVKDVNDLEKKRREVLKEAKRVEKMGNKLDGDITQAQDTFMRARSMEEKYLTLIQQQMKEGGDPQLIWNLEFTVLTAKMLARMYIKNPPYVDKNCDEVRATPVENIVATKDLLENNRTLVAMEMAVKLMTKALVQQEKATSSRRLESDATMCRSSTATKTQGDGYHGARPDNESHTGSTEVQRREAHNRADTIPISSDDRPHDKGP
jgi:hypothetical protein